MKVLLGVCGGIAAYKAAELVRLLQADGAEVEVAMTRSAQKFITPLTFAALTGKQVHVSLWQGTETDNTSAQSYEIEHITAVQGIDAFVVAPATANMTAKFAHGIADDFISAAYLATTSPVIIAPAMNVNMWQHPATQSNIATLRHQGVRVVEPDAGYLACGMTGPGRLAELQNIAQAAMDAAKTHKGLASETLLITAGGTREPLDPVRFLGNRSSGKMGHALAEAAAARGARVILVTASSLHTHAGYTAIKVGTASEMEHAVLGHLHEATIVIKAAAVADYKPATVAKSKLRRSGPLTLELLPTEDIVKKVAAQRRAGTIVVAFAAETENLEANARAKLLQKGVNAVVANDVSSDGSGFETDCNAGLFLTADTVIDLPLSSKRAMAEHILDEIAVLRRNMPINSALEQAH